MKDPSLPSESEITLPKMLATGVVVCENGPWSERVKKEFQKPKKPELPRRSVSNFDQNVFGYALEDACVKVSNVKSGEEMLPGYVYAPKSPQEHPACPISSVGGGEGTSINRLWSP